MELEVWSEEVEVDNSLENIGEVPINVEVFSSNKGGSNALNEDYEKRDDKITWKTKHRGSKTESPLQKVPRIDLNLKRNYTCEQCGKEFHLPSHLKTHLKIHASEKNFFCMVCNRSFVDAVSLRRHLTKHTGEKPYRCEECGKTFSIPNNFKKHIRTHTGEKPYVCSLCKKSFSSGSNLKTHLKSHAGERPHTCDICNKTFTLKGHLVSHHKIHFSEKAYSCNKCDRCFRVLTSLKRHLLVHKNLELYQTASDDMNIEDHVIILDTVATKKSLLDNMKQESGGNDDNISNERRKHPIIKIMKSLDPNKEAIRVDDCQADGENTAKKEAMLFNALKLKSTSPVIHDDDDDDDDIISNQPVVSIIKADGFKNGVIHVKSTFQTSSNDEDDDDDDDDAEDDYGDDDIRKERSAEKPNIRVFLANHPTMLIDRNNLNSCSPSTKSYSLSTKSNLTKSSSCSVGDEDASHSNIKENPDDAMATHRHQKYVCSACDRRFNTSTMFEEHLRFHDNGSQFTCKLCTTTFAEASSLMRHMRKHIA